MIIQFYLSFSSRFGQTLHVSGNPNQLGNGDTSQALPLQYLNEQFWFGTIEIPVTRKTGPLKYYYILRENNAAEVSEFIDGREICLNILTAENLIIYDTWNAAAEIQHVFFSEPFREVLLKKRKSRNCCRI